MTNPSPAGTTDTADNPRIVAVLSDSRGLDTYYLNPQYPVGYGIDRVFATRLGRRLGTADLPAPFDVVLLPDHFRAGSLDSKILRLALTDPASVILCDGIWETLLNREKHFERAEQLGRLPHGLFGSENTADRDRAGSVLTELFLTGDLDVSPSRYADSLNRITGYFARRRRRVYWLSLPVPPPGHRGGIHYAGNYRPLPGWDRCLGAINEAAGRIMNDWGQSVIDLDPIIECFGGADAALLDQWHFTVAFHDHLAKHMAKRLSRDLAAAPDIGRHPSHDAMIPGRVRGWPVRTLGRDVDTGHLQTLADTILVIAEPDPALRDAQARAILPQCPDSVILIYPDER